MGRELLQRVPAAKLHQCPASPKCRAEVCNVILERINTGLVKLHFLEVTGGTVKTFLISLIQSDITSCRQIVLVVASSGTAATLLLDGQTAYSVFKLPTMSLNYNDHSVCNMEKETVNSKKLKESVFIVWDEGPCLTKKPLKH